MRARRTIAVVALLLAASAALACSDTGHRVTGAGSPPAGASTPPGSGLYIALGDSLSAGIGASDASRTFVGLVHTSLGAGVELENLGVPGATSQDLLDNGTLDRAVQEIEQRKGDSDANNRVQLVTLEIGGNDLLRIYAGFVQTGVCPDMQTALAKQECSDALRAALDGFRPNLTAALDRLRQADPSLRIVLLTLYNPFQHIPAVGGLSDLSLEGEPGSPFPDGFNDVIRSTAQGRDDVIVADVYPLFEGKSRRFISPDTIHPNDAGYRAMADAVRAALNNR